MWRAILGLVFVQSLACGGEPGPGPAPAPAPALVDGADCDPTRAVCRRTLTCGFEVQDGLDLATGIVSSLDDTAPRLDVMCFLGRYVGLQTSPSNEICPMVEDVDDVEEIPADPSLCACAGGECWGSNILCGVNMTAYEPACQGLGFLVRGRDQQLYRLRIESDLISGSDDRPGSVTFDYTAVAR